MQIAKIRYIILLPLIFLYSCDKTTLSPGQADSFIKYYGITGPNRGSDVKQLPDGGYAVIGTISTLERGTDMCLIITDKYGNSVGSVKSFGGDFDDTGNSLQVLPDGGLILLGSYQSGLQGDKDIYMVRTDNKGDTLWTRTYGGAADDIGNNIQLTGNGDFIIVGYTQSYGNGQKDVLLMKTDNTGKSLWIAPRTFGSTGNDVGNYVQPVNDGYLIVGSTESTFSNVKSTNIFLIHTNQNGFAIALNNRIGGDNEDYGNCLQVLSDGNILVAGTTSSFGNGGSDILLLETTPDFSPVWQKTFGNTSNDFGSSVIASDNNIYILGTIASIGSSSSMVMITTDMNGESPVQNYFGGSVQLSGSSFEKTSDNGFIITGTNMFNDNSSVTLIKTGSNGKL